MSMVDAFQVTTMEKGEDRGCEVLHPKFYKLQTCRAKVRCFSNEKVLMITR